MNLPESFRILKKEEIARRYFVMNSFDGTLSILGVIVALYFAGVTQPKFIIVSCLGVAVALFVSGSWSAYAAEKAERVRELKELERHLMTDLDETKIGEKFSNLAILIALVNGLSPMLVSLILISPFIMAQFGLFSINYAFILSTGLIITILFSLGLIVGKVGGEKNLFYSGMKMVTAGIVVGIIVLTLEVFKVI
jgi:predicted membrane protein (TIGR00267 family)